MTKYSPLTSAVGSRRSCSAEQTRQIGIEVGKKLKAGSVLALFGELGAGKTTFVEGVVEGVTGRRLAIDSPTFTYLNIYDNRVFHFDLYRLQKAEQFLEMGFEEFLFTTGIACIEWSEKIEELLPLDTLRVRLEHQGEERWLISEMFAS